MESLISYDKVLPRRKDDTYVCNCGVTCNKGGGHIKCHVQHELAKKNATAKWMLFSKGSDDKHQVLRPLPPHVHLHLKGYCLEIAIASYNKEL